jgi:hypothetical protein
VTDEESPVIIVGIFNSELRDQVVILVQGLKMPTYAVDGSYSGEQFSNNPAWILLDILRRSGWSTEHVDLPTFAVAAAFCDDKIQTQDLNGMTIQIPRFSFNVCLQRRRNAGDVIRGIRNAARLLFTYSVGGLLQLQIENSLALQQPTKMPWSNSAETQSGGWPGYEFSDGSAAFSGILRKANGDPAIRLWARNGADSANRLTVEFQDEFNEYQQDSLALVDMDDSLLTSREVTAAFSALGLPNFDQATRMLELQLSKSLSGYTFAEFESGH